MERTESSTAVGSNIESSGGKMTEDVRDLHQARQNSHIGYAMPLDFACHVPLKVL